MRSKSVVDLRNSRPRTPAKEHVKEQPVRRVSTSTRHSPLKKKRRALRTIIISTIFVLAVFFGVGIHYISYDPHLVVSQVQVTGGQGDTDQSVAQFAQEYLNKGSTAFISDKSIFRFDPSDLAQNIYSAFPRVAQVIIHRTSPISTTITITITERQLYAKWCSTPTQCYSMDENGMIYDSSDNDLAQSSLIVTGGISTSSPPVGQRINTDHLHEIESLVALMSSGSLSVIGVSLENDTDYHITLADGSFIKVSYGQDPNEVYANLTTVLSSDVIAHATSTLQYIDLRFGDRVFYKLNTPHAATSTVATTTIATSSVQKHR